MDFNDPEFVMDFVDDEAEMMIIIAAMEDDSDVDEEDGKVKDLRRACECCITQ